MRKAIFGLSAALALASPAVAADLQIQRYSDVPSNEVPASVYRSAPPIVVEERAPIYSETVVVRRPVVVERPSIVVEEYPAYAAPDVYAYAGPAWHEGHRRHFREHW